MILFPLFRIATVAMRANAASDFISAALRGELSYGKGQYRIDGYRNDYADNQRDKKVLRDFGCQ